MKSFASRLNRIQKEIGGTEKHFMIFMEDGIEVAKHPIKADQDIVFDESGLVDEEKGASVAREPWQ